MSPSVRQLRRADEQQLRVVEAALKHGRFAVVVAGDDVWPLALKALGVKPAAEFVLESGDDTMRMFASPAAAGEGVLVLHLGEEARGAMGALNLNRDKLKARRCRFLLHLAGLDAYRRFVRDAPDAYSVRDATAVLEEQEAAGLGPAPEGESDADLERKIAEAREADDLFVLGESLVDAGRFRMAHRALDRGIALLSRGEELSSTERRTLAALHYFRGFGAPREQQRAHFQEALRELGPARGEYERDYQNILGQLRDYYGTELTSVREALGAAAQAIPADAGHVMRQMIALAYAYYSRDGIREARATLERVSLPSWAAEHLRLELAELEARTLVDEGRWRDADSKLVDTLRDFASSEERRWLERIALQRALLLVNQGEPEAAIDAIAGVDTPDARTLRLNVRRSQADPEALRALEAPSYVPPPHADFLDALAQARQDAVHARLAVRAGLLPPETLPRIDAAIAALVAHVAEVAPTDPPWSRIHAQLLLADQHLARVSEEPAAIEAATRALALARRGAPELVPKCARRIAVAALRSGATQLLDALLDEAAQAADTHHLPGQAAGIAGLRLWQAVQRGSAVDLAEKAMEDAFARSGSVLIQAEVLLHTGRGAGRRDLLDRARSIYRSLPWPEREGACLEALGRPDLALARYQAFGLRLAALALERDPTPEPLGA